MIAYVGTVVPPEAEDSSIAISRAGNLFQRNMLRSLKAVGAAPSVVLSQFPVPKFPRSRRIYVSGKSLSTDGISLRMLPFLNVPVLRQVSIGFQVIRSLVRWSRNVRGAKKVVMTYNLSEPPGLFTLIGARLIGATAVAALLDVNVPGETVPNTLVRRLDFALQNHIIPRYDAVIAINEHIVSDLCPSSPHIIIEGGVTQEFLDLFEESNPRVEPPFTVVFAGALSEANGIREMIQAFKLLPNTGFRLQIAGRGHLEDLVRKASDDDPRIEYHGYLSHDAVLEMYKGASVLLNMRLTSRINTRYFVPSKLMEYLATGVPIITTRIPHVERYAEFVYVLDSETPEALAAMIRRVARLNPEDRLEIGRAARAFAANNLEWTVQATRIRDFIDGLSTGS
ncbi:MAG: glycosyltransferase family 4 protein [Trueperella sp.]|nr:glycosyltransferase family 4 protein [Trueperella sp.]